MLGSVVSEATRLTALKGAEIIFYPTAIGWHPKEKGNSENSTWSWLSVQRAHAIANGIYVVVNRVGIEKHGKRKLSFGK